MGNAYDGTLHGACRTMTEGYLFPVLRASTINAPILLRLVAVFQQFTFPAELDKLNGVC